MNDATQQTRKVVENQDRRANLFGSENFIAVLCEADKDVMLQERGGRLTQQHLFITQK